MLKNEGLHKGNIGVEAYRFTCLKCDKTLWGWQMIKHLIKKHNMPKKKADEELSKVI